MAWYFKVIYFRQSKQSLYPWMLHMKNIVLDNLVSLFFYIVYFVKEVELYFESVLMYKYCYILYFLWLYIRLI